MDGRKLGWISRIGAGGAVVGVLLAITACSSEEDCQFTDHCEGNTAVRCVDWVHGNWFGLGDHDGHVEREVCTANQSCYESTVSGATSDERISVADCQYPQDHM